MLCKDNVANLDFKSKKNNAKHIFPSFSFFFFNFIYLFFVFFFKELTKKTLHEMHECYALQILKTKKKNGHKE